MGLWDFLSAFLVNSIREIYDALYVSHSCLYLFSCFISPLFSLFFLCTVHLNLVTTFITEPARYGGKWLSPSATVPVSGLTVSHPPAPPKEVRNGSSSIPTKVLSAGHHTDRFLGIHLRI